MLNHIDSYFNAERAESFVFIAMGALALGFAAFAMLRDADVILKGMAIPLALVGIIQLVVGGTILPRTNRAGFCRAGVGRCARSGADR